MKQNKTVLRTLLKQGRLHIIMIPSAIWFICMFYLPILGNIIAFQNYEIRKGILGSPWVGLTHFKAFFSNDFTVLLIRNTLVISSLNLVVGTLSAIALALLLNEIYKQKFKRTVQTISYLPYFVSWAVCANIFISILSSKGPVNELLIAAGLAEEPIQFLSIERLHWVIVTLQSTWRNVGWNSIIYLCAISAISDEVLEAAYVDGAGRLRRIWHIILPGILPTIAVLLIMNSGTIVFGNREQQLLMYNPLVMDVAEIIDTYVFKRGLGGGQYSFATAVGLFQTVVSVSMVFTANALSRRFAKISLI